MSVRDAQKSLHCGLEKCRGVLRMVLYTVRMGVGKIQMFTERLTGRPELSEFQRG